MLASNKRPRSDVATDRATFDKLVWLCQNAEAYDDGAYWVLSFKEVDGSLRTVRCYPGEEGTRVDAGHAHRMLFDDANNGIADRSISRLVDNPSGPRYSPQLAALLHDYALDEDDDVTRKCFWLTEFLKFLACFPAHPLGKLVRDFNDSMGTRTMAGDEAVVDMVHEQQERIQANPHTLVGAMAQEMGVLPDPAEKKMKLADWYQSKLEAISGMSSIVNDKRFMTKFESRFKNSLLAIENETDIKSRDGSDTVAGTHMVTVQTLISQWGGVPPGADVSMGIHMSNIRKELTDDRPNFRQDGLYSDQGHNIEPNLWDLHAELTSLCYNGAKKRYEACLTKKQKKDRK